MDQQETPSYRFNDAGKLVGEPTAQQRQILTEGLAEIFANERMMRDQVERNRAHLWSKAREWIQLEGEDEILVRSELAEILFENHPNHEAEGSTDNLLVDHYLDAIDRGVRGVALGKLDGDIYGGEERKRIELATATVETILRGGFVED